MSRREADGIRFAIEEIVRRRNDHQAAFVGAAMRGAREYLRQNGVNGFNFVYSQDRFGYWDPTYIEGPRARDLMQAMGLNNPNFGRELGMTRRQVERAVIASLHEVAVKEFGFDRSVNRDGPKHPTIAAGQRGQGFHPEMLKRLDS